MKLHNPTGRSLGKSVFSVLLTRTKSSGQVVIDARSLQSAAVTAGPPEKVTLPRWILPSRGRGDDSPGELGLHRRGSDTPGRAPRSCRIGSQPREHAHLWSVPSLPTHGGDRDHLAPLEGPSGFGQFCHSWLLHPSSRMKWNSPFLRSGPLHVYAPRPASSRLRGARPRVLLREVFGCIGVRLSAALFSGMSLRHRAVTPSLLGGGRSAPQVPTGALPGVPAPRVYFIAERPRRTVDPRGGTVGQASASPAVRPAEPPPPPRVPALPPRSTSPLGREPGHPRSVLAEKARACDHMAVATGPGSRQAAGHSPAGRPVLRLTLLLALVDPVRSGRRQARHGVAPSCGRGAVLIHGARGRGLRSWAGRLPLAFTPRRLGALF